MSSGTEAVIIGRCENCRGYDMSLAVVYLTQICSGCGRGVRGADDMWSTEERVFIYCSVPCAWRCGSQNTRAAIKAGTMQPMHNYRGWCRFCLNEVIAQRLHEMVGLAPR